MVILLFTGPFCGNVSPGQFTLPSTHAVIEFKSDARTNDAGFKLDWKVIGNFVIV